MNQVSSIAGINVDYIWRRKPKEATEEWGTMLTKTKGKKDKVSELLHRKKVFVFIVFFCRNRRVSNSYFSSSCSLVPLWRNTSLGCSGRGQEICEIKLQLHHHVTVWRESPGAETRIHWQGWNLGIFISLQLRHTQGWVAIRRRYKWTWLLSVCT